jgi:acetyl esterase/lipase
MDMKRPLILFTLLCSAVSVVADQPTPFRMTVMYRNLPYVANGHERQKLDLYLPSPPVVRVRARPPAEGYKERLPLIIFIHGGGFFAGSKDLAAPVEFVAQGYAVASIDYRLSGEAKFPAQIEDCKAAVRWLRANAAKYALDPDRIAVWGESAGGYLGAMLGTTGDVKEFEVGENLERSSRVNAVIDFYGPTDFVQNAFAVVNASTPEAELIGGAILENKEKAIRANPITYVTKDDAPCLIVHGDSDKLVPYNQSELLEAALKKAHVAVTLYTVKGGDHGGFDDARVRDQVIEFLTRHLSKPAKN